MTYEPNRCIISNGLASTGIASPGGIAGSLADPEQNVVSAMEDEGFLMNSQKLETAKTVSASFTSVIFRDDDYGLISWKQKLSHQRSVSIEFTNPCFETYAESFDIAGYRFDDVESVPNRLPEIVDSGELSVVEIPVFTNDNEELTEKLENETGSS